MRLTLFQRDDCHLCDLALGELARARAPEFESVFIDGDADMEVGNVVATIETPISHHGAARPEVKNSVVLAPARRIIQIAGRNERVSDARTMTSGATPAKGS